MKGNFYLFFVILSSSLESPNFHMGPIRYLNSVVQVWSPTRAGSFSSELILSTSWLPLSLLVSCFPWATNHDREFLQNDGSLLSHCV
jgi:hypothetical protein